MPKFRERPPTVHAEQFLPDKGNWFLLWRVERDDDGPYIIIPTSSGDMRVNFGDWVVIEKDGQFNVYRADRFQLKYEPVISFPDQDYYLTEHEKYGGHLQTPEIGCRATVCGPFPTEEVITC